jgi:bifunctional pyridoxal-dependent enzyme with beta-cystathionase and maltose regulon repressor activities
VRRWSSASIPRELKGLINERTKLIILNSPQNPTGGVMTEQDIEEIAAIVAEHDVHDSQRRDLFAPDLSKASIIRCSAMTSCATASFCWMASARPTR